MQVIRLSRTGRHKYPLYRIVTADKRRAATGNYIDVLGHYNPHTKELVIRKEELATAISHGAQPSNAVLKLMQKEGIELPKWASIETRNRKPRKAEEPAAEKAEAALEGKAKAEAADGDTKTAGDDEVATEAAAEAEVSEPEKTDDGTPAETADAEAAKETTEAVADAAITDATTDEK